MPALKPASRTKPPKIIFVLLPLCLLTCFSLFFPHPASAACNPPTDYSGCPPELNPDFNLSLHDVTPVANPSPQDLSLYDYSHPIDSNAPQFTGILQGTTSPQITSINTINPIMGYDSPASWSAITAIGLNTSPGQTVQLPKSGYDIGGGYAATILYADANTISLHYGAESSIVNGYTLYLQNFQVNPQIVSMYNQSSANGQSVTLAAFQSLGIAQGDLIVAIRDTGAFMDPRWRGDWWAIVYDPTNPLAPGINILITPTPTPAFTPSLECGSETPTTFRPFPYAACGMTPDYSIMDKGFATTFRAMQVVTLHYAQFTSCDNLMISHVDWGGNVIIHMEEPRLPFVGYGASDNIPQAETKYLADYFDGTLFYDGKLVDTTKKEDVARMFEEGGVFRKLAPQEIQDYYRCLMVRRAQGRISSPNPVHDYTIKYNGESQPLTAFSCPPDKVGTDAYNAWRQNTLSGRLWPAVPVTTRDDYPGEVYLTVQSPPGVLANPGPHPLSVPHMARLQEITKLVQETVLSAFSLHSLSSSSQPQNTASQDNSGQSQNLASKNNSQATSSTTESAVALPDAATAASNCQLATAARQENQPQVLSIQDSDSSRQLLAQASDIPPDDNCGLSIDPTTFGAKVYNPRRNECGILADVTHFTVTYSADGGSSTTACDHGENLHGEIGTNPIYIPDLWNGDCSYSGPKPQNSFSVTVSFDNATGSWSCDKHVVLSNTLTKDANGNWILNCGQIPVPPTPACQNPDTTNPPDRNKDAIEDTINNGYLNQLRNNPIQTYLTVQGYIIQMSKSDWDHWVSCANACLNSPTPEARKQCCAESSSGCCSPLRDFNVSRRIGTDVYLPYMKKTWEQTSKVSTSGLFHIFTPANQEDFESTWAKDEISFEFTPGWTDPSQGWLYFPYLGGTQLAKECIVNRILCSESMQGKGKACAATAQCPPLRTP